MCSTAKLQTKFLDFLLITRSLKKFPPSLTIHLQPLGLTVNEVAENFIKKKFVDWYVKQVTSGTESGVNIDDINVDLKMSMLKPPHMSCIIQDKLKALDDLKKKQKKAIKANVKNIFFRKNKCWVLLNPPINNHLPLTIYQPTQWTLTHQPNINRPINKVLFKRLGISKIFILQNSKNSRIYVKLYFDLLFEFE